MDSPSLLLTPDEACRELRVSRTWLDLRLKSGEIESVKFGTAKSSPVRIKRASLLEFIGETPDKPKRDKRAEQAELARGSAIFGVDLTETAPSG